MYELVPTISWHEGEGWSRRARRSLCLAGAWIGSQKVVHEADSQPEEVRYIHVRVNGLLPQQGEGRTTVETVTNNSLPT